MPDALLHERSDFKALVETVAESEKINDPALVEKDYWIMHAVFGLKQLGLAFELKGGTSLSEGFGIIQRFSEDIDIRIEPFDGLQVDTNPNHEKPQHVESRRLFYEKLRDKINIRGITSIERDMTYDDQALRNAGLRLSYETHFGSIADLKEGFSWKSVSIRRLPTARLRFLRESSSLLKPRRFNTRTTEPSKFPVTTPSTHLSKKSKP
jgi:Nucleotidyl transferase AbiEii toxin, Type IV TA system